jgi:hypothetical protein
MPFPCARVLSILVTSIALALLAASPAAADGPRVAVLPFEGAEAISTRIAVYQALESEGVELASLSGAADAARRARLRGMSRRRLDRALELLDADAALQGRTRVEDDDVRVRLVLAGADGAVFYDREVGLDELEDAAQEIHRALGRSSRAEPRLAARAARIEEERPVAPRERGERRGSPDSAPDEAAPATPSLPWIVAGIGASARMRDAAFDAADGTRFHRAWYPSIDLGAELRPFHATRGLERGLFLRASFYHSVGLRSIGPNDTVVDTAFWGLSADGGLLVGVGSGWDVGFTVGVGVDSFGLADTSATLVPTAVYGTLRPGLRARAQLLEELVVLDIGLGYRWVFDRGPIGAAFGRQGESHGFEGGVSLGGSVDVGFSWAVSADLTAVAHQMHGDADLVPATGGRDLGVRLGARIGMALR